VRVVRVKTWRRGGVRKAVEARGVETQALGRHHLVWRVCPWVPIARRARMLREGRASRRTWAAGGVLARISEGRACDYDQSRCG